MKIYGMLACSVLLAFIASGSPADDSTSFQPRSSVGYEPPARARAADSARHANTADSLAKESPRVEVIQPQRGPVCGTGAPRRCRKQEPLPPGYYQVKCLRVNDRDEPLFYVLYGMIMTGEGELTSCPGSKVGGSGLTGKYITRILRIS